MNHIEEDWGRWLIPPNFSRCIPPEPNAKDSPSVDFRFKAVGPNPELKDSTSYRMGLRITKDMTVQTVADACIQFGRSLHRFVRAYDGGKRRTVVPIQDILAVKVNDDLEPIPYVNDKEGA